MSPMGYLRLEDSAFPTLKTTRRGVSTYCLSVRTELVMLLLHTEVECRPRSDGVVRPHLLSIG